VDKCLHHNIAIREGWQLYMSRQYCSKCLHNILSVTISYKFIMKILLCSGLKRGDRIRYASSCIGWGNRRLLKFNRPCVIPHHQDRAVVLDRHAFPCCPIFDTFVWAPHHLTLLNFCSHCDICCKWTTSMSASGFMHVWVWDSVARTLLLCLD